jgi:hypothetical protein
MHLFGAIFDCIWCVFNSSLRKAPKMNNLSIVETMKAPKQGPNALFSWLGAIMALAMHAGFASLEQGIVGKKNEVSALVKIVVDFSDGAAPEPRGGGGGI